MVRKSKEKFKVYKNVFDEFTLKTLHKLSAQGHFEELLSPVKIGKESNVFLAEAGNDYVIVKIYRLESANFKQMLSYITSDPRFMDIKHQRRLVIFKWVLREYKNLLSAREVVNVPQPIAYANNVIVMESIGENQPASQLKDELPKDIEKFAKKVVSDIQAMYDNGLVHGDVSEFNILNYKDKPYFIDFSQGTTVKDPHALTYVKRDLQNVARFFKKHKVIIDAEEEFFKLKKRNT